MVNALGVTAQAASRWYHAWRSGGRDALIGAARLGRPARLSDEQVGQVETALLAGPTKAEAGDRTITTAIPDGTTLNGVSIKNGIATVDFSTEFDSGGGTASMRYRLAQVVYTLTQFSTVRSVVFQVEGQTVTVFGSEGIVLDDPSKRADWTDELPAIFVRGEDDTESLLNFSVDGGDIVIHRVAREFIVRRGRLTGCIVNKGFVGTGERLDSGTLAPTVQRERKGVRP